MEEFADLIALTTPSVVIGAESWLDDTIRGTKVFPFGHVAYRRDGNVRGGGAFVFVHESLQSFEIRVNCLKCGSVWCRIA